MKCSEIERGSYGSEGVHYFGNTFNSVIYAFLLLYLCILFVMYDLFFVFCFIVLYSVSCFCSAYCVCNCVLYCCHRVSTQIQLVNISILT